MRKLFFILTIVCFTGSLSGQNTNVLDSLYMDLQETDGKDKFKILMDLANHLLYISPDRTEYYAKEALALAKEYNDTINIIASYRILGGKHQYQSQYDSAIYYYSKAIEIAKIIDDKREIGVSMANLGNIFSDQQNFEKARTVYQHSLEMIKEAGDPGQEARLLNNLGITCNFLKQYDAAIKYLQEALEIKMALGDSISTGVTYSNMGQVYKTADSLQKAEEYYFKALKIFNENSSMYNTAFVNNKLANLFFDSEDYDKAYYYITQAIAQANTVNANAIVKEGYDLLIKYSIAKQDYLQAINYYKEYVKLSEEITENQNQKLLSELEIKYETEIKEQKLQSKDITIRQQQYLLYLFLVIVITSIIFTLIIFIQKRRLTTANEFLVKTNMDIVASHKELQKLKEQAGSELVPGAGQDHPVDVSEDEDNIIIRRIVKAIETDKLFMDSNLTIFQLADILNTNKTYISNALNTRMNKNFNTYINELRVAEARDLMADPSNDSYTIAAIAEKSGFNSISTFNRSFKIQTGVTPSFFWKSIQNKRK
ncbi:MAG: AraC family transcriptional regulator [Bacteroidota bacterium]